MKVNKKNLLDIKNEYLKFELGVMFFLLLLTILSIILIQKSDLDSIKNISSNNDLTIYNRCVLYGGKYVCKENEKYIFND